MTRLLNSLILLLCSISMWAQTPVGKLSDRHYLDYKIQSSLLFSNAVLSEKIKLKILPNSICTDSLKTDYVLASAEEFTVDLTKDGLYFLADTLYVLTSPIQNFRERSFLDSVDGIHPNFFTEFKYTSRKIARLHGVAAVSVWFLSEFVQIVSIPITAALGIPEVGVMIVASPLNFINMAITIKIINIKHQVSLKRAYGGHATKRAAIKAKRKIENLYKIKNENTIIHYLDTKNDTNYYVSLNRNNLFTEAFSLFRLNQHKVYYRNIKRFCKRELSCDTLNKILKSKHISKQMRSVYALEYLHKNNPELFHKFSGLHYKSFHQHAGDKREIGLRDDVKRWVYQLCEIKNLSELESILRQIPPQIKVYETLDLFDSIILKYWAENMNKQGFSSFRKMVKGFMKSNYQLLQVSDEYFGQKHVDIILLNSGLYYK